VIKKNWDRSSFAEQFNVSISSQLSAINHKSKPLSPPNPEIEVLRKAKKFTGISNKFLFEKNDDPHKTNTTIELKLSHTLLMNKPVIVQTNFHVQILIIIIEC